MDKRALDRYYIYDFLSDQGKLLSTCEAAMLLPDNIYRLEGFGTLFRDHFHNLNDWAHSFIEKQDAQQKRLVEQAASAAQPQPSPPQASWPPPHPQQQPTPSLGTAPNTQFWGIFVDPLHKEVASLLRESHAAAAPAPTFRASTPDAQAATFSAAATRPAAAATDAHPAQTTASSSRPVSGLGNAGPFNQP